MNSTAPYKPKRLPTIKFKDLMAMKINIQWLIDNVVPLCSVVMIAGDSGIGKTWLLLDLILAVATGGLWLGQFKCKQGSVLVFDEENIIPLLQERLSQLCAARGIGKLSNLPIEFMVGQFIDITPLRDYKTGEEIPSHTFLDVLETAKAIKPTMMTFDSFIRFHHANENSSTEMKAVSAQIKRMSQETGAACVINHHFVKSGSGASGQRIRGSGDIRANVDMAFLVDECKGGITITHDKPRFTKKLEPFTVKLSQDENKGTFTVAYQGVKPQVTKQTPWEFIRSLLSSGGKSRAEIVEQASGIFSASRIDKELRYRHDEGEIAKNKQGHDVVYTLPILIPIADAEPNGLAFLDRDNHKG